MSEKWDIAEGAQKLLANDFEDLSAYERQITLDVSFAVVEAEQMQQLKGIDKAGINVMLTSGEGWIFSDTFAPDDGETPQELAKRIANALGIEPGEKVWLDANA